MPEIQENWVEKTFKST